MGHQESTRLKGAHGNWVEGDRFWDREADIELLVDHIRDEAHVLIVAQRRMGKTSLMREVARRLRDTYTCVFVDFQGACSAPDAIVDLSVAVRPHKGLWGKTKDLFYNILGGLTGNIDAVEVGELRVKLRAGLSAGNWADKGNELFSILASSEKVVLLFMDEVPILVNRILKGDDFQITPERRAKADEFMSWLRENGVRHKGKVRMVLSGSIGLEPVLHQAQLSATLNAFLPFELRPWDEATAEACLEALASEYGVRFEQGVAAEMVRRLGCCIPHHVQMFFDHVRTTCIRGNNLSFRVDEVAGVYEREMLSVRGHAELTHYEERLKLVLGGDLLPLALEMLSEAAVTGQLTRESLAALQKYYSLPGRTTDKAEQEILQVLEHDGYLRHGPQGYAFISNLLRDWWRKRYDEFYTPVLKRGG